MVRHMFVQVLYPMWPAEESRLQNPQGGSLPHRELRSWLSWLTFSPVATQCRFLYHCKFLLLSKHETGWCRCCSLSSSLSGLQSSLLPAQPLKASLHQGNRYDTCHWLSLIANAKIRISTLCSFHSDESHSQTTMYGKNGSSFCLF